MSTKTRKDIDNNNAQTNIIRWSNFRRKPLFNLIIWYSPFVKSININAKPKKTQPEIWISKKNPGNIIIERKIENSINKVPIIKNNNPILDNFNINVINTNLQFKAYLLNILDEFSEFNA